MLNINPIKTTFIALLITLSWLSLPLAQALDPDELLSADDAFQATAIAENADTIAINWTIAEGYYLYRHSLKFTSNNSDVSFGEPDIPSGKQYTDEFFGEVETYRNTLNVRLPVTANNNRFDLTFTYQGCADLGVCYPPERKTVSIDLPAAANAALNLPGLAGAQNSSVLNLPGLTSGNNNIVFAEDALPPEQAFQYEAIALDGNQILVRMTAATGYYLYRDKFNFSVNDPDINVTQIDLPAGVAHNDEHFGDIEIYYNETEIPVQLRRSKTDAKNIELIGNFQGCKAAGICYPPMQRSLSINLPVGNVTAVSQSITNTASGNGNINQASAADAPVAEQDRLAATLDGAPLKAMLLFFIAGLLLAFTPCIFPMVPILSGIIAGQGDNITTRKALMLSIIYVLAMALTYTAAGVFAGLFGSNLQAAFQNPWIISSFSLLFVALAMSMFGFYELQVPNAIQTRLSMLSNKQSGGSLVGVAVMGMLSALIVGPCVAPALAAALIYIGQTGDAILGGLALFALALGMGIPLIIFGVSAGSLLPRAGGWMNAVKSFFGVGLLALALWMLERILPGEIILLLWSLLFISTGVYMGALEAANYGWPRLWKALGFSLLAFGLIQLLGFAMGGNDWTRPLHNAGFSQSAATEVKHFEVIKSLDDLQSQLGNGPVMLDFYADWCIECKRMEKYTFPESAVQQALQNVRLIQADVTANDGIDKALLQHFSLIGPPAILFFDAAGNEIKNRRVIGYLDAEDFSEHVEGSF